MDLNNLKITVAKVTSDDRKKLNTGQVPPKLNAMKVRLSFREFTETMSSVFMMFGKDTYPNIVYCSIEPLKSLKRIAIAEMRVNIPAKGYYLLLRTIEEPYRVNGILTVVEDHKGDVYMFSAYNLVSIELEKKPGYVLPVGTVFCLKEPYMKSGSSDSCVIRCNSPSDVVIISRHHEMYSTIRDISWKNEIKTSNVEVSISSESWKFRGNALFKKNNYIMALDCYLMAMKLLNSGNTDLLIILELNLSATFLNLKYFENAFVYASAVLKKDSVNLKALYRAGRASYELRKFKDAKPFFERLLTASPKHEDGLRELKRTKCRLQEELGRFDIYGMYKLSKEKPNSSLDCADFVGPLKVCVVPEKGRIVTATKNIGPGTLLVVSKALVSEFNSSALKGNSIFDMGEVHSTIQELSQIVVKNPNTFGAAVYDLPINDGFLDAVKPKLFCDEDNKTEPIADVERIRKILRSNGVEIGNSDACFGLVNGEESSCGLFLFPSYLNHSCSANAGWAKYNDVMVIHAKTHIRKEEEVTIPYIDPQTRFSLKERTFDKREFKCLCRYCELDRQEPERLRERREELILNFENVANEAAKSEAIDDYVLETLTKNLIDIEKLYKAAPAGGNQLYLVGPYTILASFNSPFDTKAAIILSSKAISALGFDSETIHEWSKGKNQFAVPPNANLQTILLENFVLLVYLYENEGLHSEADKFLKILYVGHNILSGSNQEMTLKSFIEIPNSVLERSRSDTS